MKIYNRMADFLIRDDSAKSHTHITMFVTLPKKNIIYTINTHYLDINYIYIY